MKKINIARALLENRPLLLVDEFKSGLDEESSKLITDKLFDSENTIIMISHNLDKSFLKRFDSIIFMEKGKLLQNTSMNYYLKLVIISMIF
ncbi:hypothetical protein HMPREF9192_0793 [Streptococcus vestibularis F0396]|uniref:ABC transporter domain-containing protein n=1 Tax=Streptococcus vestibularis F0396 TaxID=904306 RepID=E3CR72_STRVE|nr:hypothetical protein HMPREF9192_0793 [Streptococcus vestibularis F0396]